MEEPAHDRITQDSIRKKLAALQQTPEMDQPKPAPPTPPAGLDRYLRTAAVLVYYDPETIMPLPAPDGAAEDPGQRKQCIDYLVGCSEVITDTREYEKTPKDAGSITHSEKVPVRYKIQFTLRDDIRKKVLLELFREKKVTEALDTTSSLSAGAGYVLQTLFTGYLKGRPVEMTALTLEELNALCRVSEWLSDITQVKNLPSKKDIGRRIEITEMLAPLRHLTGIYVDGHFQSLFRGRSSELSTLREYVGVAPPKGVMETVTRIWSSVKGTLFSSTKIPLLIFGIGGIGKSTLLAQFILEHMEAQMSDRFPFVYLDFDRPQLNALEPETLLIEAARQIAVQYPDLNEICEEFSTYYKKWNQTYSTWIDAGSTETIALRSAASSQQKEVDRSAMQEEFLTLARRLAKLVPKPFVIVLDTFEEVQYKGAEYARQLYDFMIRLADRHPLVRTIAAGRAPVQELNIQRLELSSLDNEAACGYLMRTGDVNEAEAKQIVSLIGGNPLTLKLAAELVEAQGISDLKELKLTQKGQFNLISSRLPELQIQGILYRRILSHIHKPELKKLAYPGMVLRRITPEIILKVLAGPCGLNVKNMDEAQALFDDVGREVALVVPSEPNVLRHRSDVRKAMLKLLQQSDKAGIVPQIHTAAAEYYRGRDGMVDRAEEFYHRLSLDESPRDLDTRWQDGIQNYLLNSLDELPPKAQAYLLAKSGRESDDLSVWDSADMEDQNRRIAKQAANLLNAGHGDSALTVLEGGIAGKGSEVLTMLKVRALFQLKRLDEAADLARQALQSYYADEFAPAVTLELQRFAAPPIRIEGFDNIDLSDSYIMNIPRDIDTGRSSGPDETTFFKL